MGSQTVQRDWGGLPQLEAPRSRARVGLERRIDSVLALKPAKLYQLSAVRAKGEQFFVSALHQIPAAMWRLWPSTLQFRSRPSLGFRPGRIMMSRIVGRP
jgi:hypothetical protein